MLCDDLILGYYSKEKYPRRHPMLPIPKSSLLTLHFSK